jgi:hypothetical protein
MKAVALVFAVSLCGASMLQAQSLKQREMIASDKVQFAKLAAQTNAACGTNINFSIDYSTFSDVLTSPDNPNNQQPWALAANATDAVKSVCGSDEGKAAVKQKITKVNITHAKQESEKLNGSTLDYAVPYSGAGVQTIVKYLKDTL